MTASAPINSRFKILQRPLVSPGKCAVCGAVDREVVDFNFDIRFYGTVYFCIHCIEEIATILGMVPLDILQAVERESRQSVIHYLQANNLRVITDEQYELLTGAISSLSDVAVNTVPDLYVENSDAVPDLTEGSAESDADSDVSESESTGGQSETLDIVFEHEGPTSVPASAVGTDGDFRLV